MTATGYHDVGEEWVQKTTYRQDLLGSRVASVDVLLYDDSTDSLSDGNDIGDITTEPTDGNYGRRAVSLDGTDVSLSIDSGDTRATATLTFDVSNTTGDINAYAIVVNFQSDVVNSETSTNDHLLTSAELGDGSTISLGGLDSLDVEANVDLS